MIYFAYPKEIGPYPYWMSRSKYGRAGIHLTNRKYLNAKFSLYALHMFFVEVELSLADKIIGKKVFKTGQIMDKYAGDLGI